VITVRLEALISLVQKLKASHDQGLITDEEFNSLAAKHMDEIDQLEQEAVRRRLVVELFELEDIEEKLARAFSAKIAELNETTSLIRRKLGLEGAEVGEAVAMPIPPAAQVVSAPSASASTSAADASPKTGAPQPVGASQTTDAIRTESTTRAPESLETKPQQKQAKKGDGEGESKERDVEDELSRIRTDVEKLLEELEQMEQPRS